MPNFLLAHVAKQKRCAASTGVQPQVLPSTAEGPTQPALELGGEEEAPVVCHSQQLLDILN